MTISLSKTRYPWAEIRTIKSSVKFHLSLVYIGKRDAYLDKVVITKTSVHDVSQLEIVVDEHLDTHIFGRGYLDFKRVGKLSHDGFFFVSRIKKNTLVRVLEEYEISRAILQDYVGRSGWQKCYLTNPYRLVKVTET